jgi:hypothetical protein
VEFDTETSDYIVTFNLTWKGLLNAPLTQSYVGRLKYIKKEALVVGTAAPIAFLVCSSHISSTVGIMG